MEVIFTKENETADERIEKLAIELNNPKNTNSCGNFGFYRAMGDFWTRGTYENLHESYRLK